MIMRPVNGITWGPGYFLFPQVSGGMAGAGAQNLVDMRLFKINLSEWGHPTKIN